MPLSLARLVLWLLVIVAREPWSRFTQNSPSTGPPSSLREYQENGSLYFPGGPFKRPDGTADDHFGDTIAWYLRSIGEPPLARFVERSESQAYRLIWMGFPAGKTVVVRLQIHSDRTAELFAKQTRFDGADLLFETKDSISNAAVDGFLECLNRGDFWHQPARESPEPQMPDGSYWYFEGARRGEYRLVYRRTPELKPGPFTDIGRYLAKDLARLPDSIISIPRGNRSEPARKTARE